MSAYRTKKQKNEKKLKKDLLPLLDFFGVAQPGKLSPTSPKRSGGTLGATRWASQQAASGAREMGDNWHQAMQTLRFQMTFDSPVDGSDIRSS